ncbi:MAG: hypothetical protein AAGH15_05375 [Myxococcota bacterium]
MDLIAPKARRKLDPELVAKLETRLAAHLAPCVWLQTERAAPAPPPRSWRERLIGRPPPTDPVLGPLASKLGGRPYAEAGDAFEGHTFLGQLDLTAASEFMPDLALRGLLGFDAIVDAPDGELVRARWYPEPSLERCVEVEALSAVPHEARIDFRAGFVAPSDAQLVSWFPALRRYPDSLVADAVSDGDGDHRLFGPKRRVFDHDDPSEAPFVQLLSLGVDQASGLHFGSNVLYLLVPEDDWRAGDLAHVFARLENG